MAQKLHDTYKFSYDKLKVLLGGWNTWKQENAKDAAAYPIEITAGSTTPGASTPATKGGVPATIELQAAPANTVAPNGAAPPPGLVPIPGKTP